MSKSYWEKLAIQTLNRLDFELVGEIDFGRVVINHKFMDVAYEIVIENVDEIPFLVGVNRERMPGFNSLATKIDYENKVKQANKVISDRQILLDKPGKFLCYDNPYDVFMTDRPLPSHQTWEWINGEWVKRTWKHILADENGDEIHRYD